MVGNMCIWWENYVTNLVDDTGPPLSKLGCCQVLLEVATIQGLAEDCENGDVGLTHLFYYS